ncbi:NAD(P)H-binding protein [Microbispora corallina]|uniref:Nucleotide-diphosphate-sugar epimerase n=1 Tax=Microbispora corallina TaxID=83302 RepID=A0ABQ4G730_9ACTN|nr:NAD(P)H-binding protein [Microbispora corallina]GIH42846.1 nucleotide-diphosphate-sugar epimerase [Microbispora corallina]
MILVTGATGNVGGDVVGELVEAGHDVRALTRNPERAKLPPGVEVVRGDLSAPETLPAALAGVEAVFLYAVPGSAPAFVRAALDAGVRRVVMLSSLAVRDDVEVQSNPIGAFHAEIEDAVAASGLEWTFLRPGAFATNVYQWAGQVKAGDVVRLAFPDAATAPIHEADIAAVGVRALTADGHAGAKYPMTGPESLTHRDQVRIVGEAIGRPLRLEELPPDLAREQMLTRVPAPVVDSLFALMRASVGQEAYVIDTVEKVLGRPARTFAQWAADHADDLR